MAKVAKAKSGEGVKDDIRAALYEIQENNQKAYVLQMVISEILGGLNEDTDTDSLSLLLAGTDTILGEIVDATKAAHESLEDLIFYKLLKAEVTA